MVRKKKDGETVSLSHGAKGSDKDVSTAFGLVSQPESFSTHIYDRALNVTEQNCAVSALLIFTA